MNQVTLAVVVQNFLIWSFSVYSDMLDKYVRKNLRKGLGGGSLIGFPLPPQTGLSNVAKYAAEWTDMNR